MLTSLNPAQARAAEALSGPVLVIAGAGTGKTRTLVHRLANLVRSGVPADRILLLTFTRRAAEEMIARAASLLAHAGDPGCERVAGGTFHSFANLVLRHFGKNVGLTPDFTILDQADSLDILGHLRAEMGLSDRARGFPKRETVGAILSKAANKQVPLRQVVLDEYLHLEPEVPTLEEIQKRYRGYKRERFFVDFDDLLVYLLRLLKECPPARERLLARYLYLMVDEYQDTNLLQADITRLLIGPERNIMVVGDDAQSIYAFRGACFQNLFDLHRELPGAQLLKLEQNYRSSQPILDVGNAVLGQMSQAFRKRLFTERQGGERPLLVEAFDEREQARFVLTEVQRLRAAGVPLAEIAVLFRAGSHSFALEVELAREQLPYVKYGGFRFLDAAHIKDVLCHLRLLHNPKDDLSLLRVLQLCEGIGQAGARRIRDALAAGAADTPLAEALRECPAKGKSREGLLRLADLLGRLHPTAPARCLQQTVEHYTPILKLRFDDWPKRQRDLEQLCAMGEGYRSLESLLSDMAIQPPNAARRENLTHLHAPGEHERPDELVLSTMHSAKGLEWRVVFVIQAADGCIPMFSSYSNFAADRDDTDEELRLFYVAVTRAKEALCIVWPRETQRGLGWAEPSRFLQRMPADLLRRVKARTALVR